MTPLQSCAIELATMGMAVFPIVPLGKTPMTNNGFYSGTTDLSIVEQWWKRTPKANIGVATGKKSGLWALDVDNGSEKNGLQDLQNLCEEHGPLPETRAVITPSGGMHFYFQYDLQHPINNSVSKIAGGLDTRGDGGYVVAPASRRVENEYVWASESPIAVAPAWLTDLLCKPKEVAVKPLKRIPLTGTNVDLALKCLNRLHPSRADNYQQWVEVGMSLYGLGYAGLQLWDDWSHKSSKYAAGECEKKWKSFALIGIGLGSLVHWADEDSPLPRQRKQGGEIDFGDIIRNGF